MSASLTALAIAAALAGATDSPALRAAFKATIVSTYPDGRQAELWLNKDGSYIAEGRRHDRSNGHWTVKDERICLKQSQPPTLPFSYCTAVPSGGVGATWSAKSVTGEPIQVKVVAGRKRQG